MKTIYRTRLMILDISYIYSLVGNNIVNKSYYDDIDRYIEDKYYEYISTHKINLEGIEDHDISEICLTNTSNQIKVPYDVLSSVIYVTKTILPDVVREIITGKYFKITSDDCERISRKNICVVDEIRNFNIVETDSDYGLVKNYLLNSDLIKHKIELVFKVKEEYIILAKDIKNNNLKIIKEKAKKEALKKLEKKKNF